MEFEKIYIIFSVIVVLTTITAIGLWMENRKLERENERMRKILYWRGYE